MLRKYSAMDVTGDYTAQNLSARQRDVITAKECLQSAEVCLALAHKTTKELDTRAALLEFAYEFRTAAKHLERDERELMVRAASPNLWRIRFPVSARGRRT
jgi:hypothetical protein